MYNERDRVGLSRSRAIEKIALFYVAVLAGLLHRFPANFTQQTAGQIRNRESGGSAGAKASEQGEEITFADVAGVDEAKSRARRNCEFLWNPDKYIRLGARPPRGVLLELWNLQWLAGIAVYHVQMIREVAIPSEELHLEKSSWVVNCDWKFYSSHGS